MESANPLNTRVAGSPSASPFTQVPSRAAPVASAYVTSVDLHPVEPFQVVGLSSGELCLYTAGTDALSWLVEMDAARHGQLRLNQAMGVPANAGGGAHAAAVAISPPDNPLKVFSFASLSSSAAAAGGCAIVHCGFLRGREEDLMREVVQPLQPGLAAASSSSLARRLLYVVTSANDIFVADVKSEVVLVRWGASTAAHNNNNVKKNNNNRSAAGNGGRGGAPSSAISTASPLHAQFIVTQVETYGALLFLTVARRSAVQAVSAALGNGVADGGRGPERNALDHCSEPLVYVLHVGYTKPFAAATTKGLIAGGGAYVIKAVSQDKRKLRDPSRSSMATATVRNSLSIRVHPFAPLLLLLINRAEVQVFAVDGDAVDVAPKAAQLVFFNSPLSSATSSKSPALASASATPPAPLLDAQFVPSAAVLVRSSDHSASASSGSSRWSRWSCRNVQILLLSSTRLRLVCTRPAFVGEAAGPAGTVAVDRVFYTAPEMGVPPGAASSPTTTSPHSHVYFVHAWTWLASPDTVFLLQSDRTLLELSCNDFIAASTAVPSVRSRRLLPPRTMVSRTLVDTRNDATQSTKSNNAQLGNWWLIPPTTAGGLPCVSCPPVLPLWGRGSVLSGVFAPRLPAYHSEDPQTLVFSRLTGLARPLPIPPNENDDYADAALVDPEQVDGAQRDDVFHLSLLADTEAVSSRCISIRLCLTPLPTAAAGAASSPDSSATAAPRVTQESVNVNIARVLCDAAAAALCRLEHGFYFVGSRAESAYADYPFIVAGLQYVDGIVPDGGGGSDAQLRVAMVCLPADRRELRRLYDTARAGGGDAFTPSWTPPAELKRTLQQAVHHAQVQSLPVPQFDFELPHAAKMTKQLLSCAFQLSNDGVVPCVWGLWAPVFPHRASPSASATMGSPLPPPQSLQLTMQSFYVAAESQQLLWRPPELVQMDDLLVSNPSQVFALNSVLTKGGCIDASAAALPAPYTSLDDVLTDVDAAVVARLFLYYADRKVLVLATVETGSSREAGFDPEVIDEAYNFASRARNGRVLGGRLFTGGAADRASETRGDGRQYLRLVPHAAAEMNTWKGDNTAESLSCALLSAVQLSAVMVNDHGEPALQVAVTSRRFGVALALFPLVGRRGVARVSTALQPVKVYLYRRWDELLCITAAATQPVEENERSGSTNGPMSSPPRHRGAAEAATTAALSMEDVQHTPLLRRYRAWVDTVAYPTSTYASVPLAEWVWPPAWPVEGDNDEGAGEEMNKASTRTSAAAANPILLLQRGRALYVLHRTGAAVQVCSSLLHCSPLQIVPRAATTTTTATTTTSSSSPPSAPCELYLQYGSYPGLLARSRLLRHLQLQHGPFSYYADATVSSQSPAGKVKWFKKFLKSANSAEAARQRAREWPRQMAWLQHAYAPGVEDLAYQFSSSNSSHSGGKAAVQSMTPLIGANLARLVGAGVTHVGNVLDVNFTDPIRLATLAVEALAASRGMQQLVSAAGMLTDSLRQTLRHLATVLEHSSGINGNGSSVSVAGQDGTPMSVMRGNWAVAEALARLPLGCVMKVMGQEVRRAAAAASAAMAASSTPAGSARRGSGSGDGVRDARTRNRLADLQRWWWLLMRCSALVTAVNTVQIDDASRVMAGVFEELPLSSPLLQPPSDEEAAAHRVAQALLLCSPRFMPRVVPQMLESGTTSATQRVQLFEAAVKAALKVLGAAETTTAAALAASPANVDNDANTAVEGTVDDPAKMKGNSTNDGGRRPTSWSSLFSTVRVDGAHWTHAVYYANLLSHIRSLASAEDAEEDGVSDSVRTMAAQCLSGVDVAVEASAAAVLDVATQTVGVLLGAVVDVPAASRTRMANAVAQSTSKRHEVLQSGDTANRVTDEAEAAASADVPFLEEDVYFLDQTPIDQLRHSLYALQWRDLYGTFGYPTRYFFRSAAAASSSISANSSSKTGVTSATWQRNTSTLPYQLTYDAYMSSAHVRETATNAQPAADAAPSATSRHHRGQVQKVLLTEQTHGPAAVAPPTMELVPLSSAPPSKIQNSNSNGGGAGADGHGTAALAATQPSPLSLRAAVAKEEADLHNTYFNGFAAHDEERNSTVARNNATAATSAGVTGDVSNDSIARNFEAQLQNVGAADEDVSTSAVQRERQKAADRQRVPNASAFAPSATRRATSTAAAAGENAYGDHLYGAVPSQQAFFARFQAEEED
ncbi:hypothetical protein ABB37_08802 [Leptomonas pyrrhocoris]|uniref:Uncharacterized protein n=1 Tax=Leptomonas pyrrhocoris TaxID=157538 RepID=A0A0M9FSL1_LEPPY|nr:hypothetical protein ABB37_08802 [Leptomonas pyrrhocoris]KPA75137.1 hypothetical protein ABB37_08802 [Leptomonas pyrrhocoris]|eukprot:XP_015653576.1 hypothetical protein ABB37_08802 [Leptomonas pyrrhocoris]